MKAMIDKAVELGVESIDIGMPHRGRLNVLANVMRKPMEEMLYEFMEGTVAADEEGHLQGSGNYYVCFLMVLCIRPHTTTCVLVLYTCVLILLSILCSGCH